MPLIDVSPSWGHLPVSRHLSGMVGLFETTFPRRIRGYYLLGSYADASNTLISDIDLVIIFQSAFLDQDEMERAQQVALYGGMLSSIRLDIIVLAEQDVSNLHSILQIALKEHSQCVYGEDVRSQLTLPPMQRYLQDVTGGAMKFISTVMRRQEQLTYPLTYPDATDRWYGYATKRIDAWYPAEQLYGTKELVALVTRIAAARVAMKHHVYIGSKTQALHVYQERMNDEWTGLVATICQNCQQHWQYQLPQREEDRQCLRGWCQQVLGLENHFVQEYQQR